MQEQEQLPAKQYINLLYYFVLAVSVIIVLRILSIQFFQSSKLIKQPGEKGNMIIKKNVIKARRGTIFSDDRKIFAISTPLFDVSVDMNPSKEFHKNYKNNSDSLCYYLTLNFPGKTKKQYKNLLDSLEKENVKYYKLLKGLTYQDIKKVRDFPLFKLGSLKGGYIEEEHEGEITEKRINPYGSLAYRTIGVFREENKVGLERSLDVYLAGKDGQRYVERVAAGKYIPTQDDYIIQPRKGYDFVSTINTKIQDVADFALRENLTKQEADWGCVILMEVKTGEVRAMANLVKQPDGSYRETKNLALLELYEPGSSFKLFSFLLLLEDGGLDLNQYVETGNGTFNLGKHPIKDSHPNGRITVKQVFEKSSNIGTAKLVLNRYRKTPEKFLEHLKAIYIDRPLGITFKGELNPVFPASLRRDTVTMGVISYGYGLKISPLSLLTYYNAVANDGKLMRPMFIKEVVIENDSVYKLNPFVIKEKICSYETAKILQGLLRGVVEEGTGQKFVKSTAFEISGKTATARINSPAAKNAKDKDDDGQKEQSKRYNASFVGFFPSSNPKYSCLVLVSNPKHGYYGGEVAGPVFKQIAEIVYANELDLHSIENLKPDIQKNCLTGFRITHQNTVKAYSEMLGNTGFVSIPDGEWLSLEKTLNPDIKKADFNQKVIPDVRGLSLKDALYILEKLGVNVTSEGFGKVKTQSVEPGTKINSKISVHLTLN